MISPSQVLTRLISVRRVQMDGRSSLLGEDEGEHGRGPGLSERHSADSQCPTRVDEIIHQENRPIKGCQLSGHVLWDGETTMDTRQSEGRVATSLTGGAATNQGQRTEVGHTTETCDLVGEGADELRTPP